MLSEELGIGTEPFFRVSLCRSTVESKPNASNLWKVFHTAIIHELNFKRTPDLGQQQGQQQCFRFIRPKLLFFAIQFQGVLRQDPSPRLFTHLPVSYSFFLPPSLSLTHSLVDRFSLDIVQSSRSFVVFAIRPFALFVQPLVKKNRIRFVYRLGHSIVNVIYSPIANVFLVFCRLLGRKLFLCRR